MFSSTIFLCVDFIDTFISTTPSISQNNEFLREAKSEFINSKISDHAVISIKVTYLKENEKEEYSYEEKEFFHFKKYVLHRSTRVVAALCFWKSLSLLIFFTNIRNYELIL